MSRHAALAVEQFSAWSITPTSSNQCLLAVVHLVQQGVNLGNACADGWARPNWFAIPPAAGSGSEEPRLASPVMKSRRTSATLCYHTKCMTTCELWRPSHPTPRGMELLSGICYSMGKLTQLYINKHQLGGAVSICIWHSMDNPNIQLVVHFS